MESRFKPVKPSSLKDNAFKIIGSDWMLITAGNIGKYTMMTASWGAMGVLWGKDVVSCVVRPTRYTYGFIEESDNFTLCFFSEKHRKILDFCGSKSGRDVDKTKAAGLTPVKGSLGGVYFKEARLVFECKKIYFQDLDNRNFLLPEIEDNYPNKDYHRMYVGEIKKVLKG